MPRVSQVVQPDQGYGFIKPTLAIRTSSSYLGGRARWTLDPQ